MLALFITTMSTPSSVSTERCGLSPLLPRLTGVMVPPLTL